MKNGDKTAYPVSCTVSPQGQWYDSTDVQDGAGLTKREMFAMAAMQGIIAGHPDQIHNQTQGVTLAVRWADELLKALES